MSEKEEKYLEKKFKGIRVRTLKKFLFFVVLLRQRLKTLDWDEWKKRDIKHRYYLRQELCNYLSSPDKQERQYFKEHLGSERLVYDYWKTMLELAYLLRLD